jgi:hypothetical protein
MSNEQKRKQASDRLKKYIVASRNRRNNKTAGLRQIANDEPHEVGIALDEFVQVFSDAAEVLSGLADDAAAFKSNLDLSEPAKTASIRDRVAARRNYARTLRRLANEAPQEIAGALSEVYAQLDDAAEGIEALAERFGLPLTPPETTMVEDNEENRHSQLDSIQPTAAV